MCPIKGYEANNNDAIILYVGRYGTYRMMMMMMMVMMIIIIITIIIMKKKNSVASKSASEKRISIEEE